MPTHGKPRKVFIKVHINAGNTFGFDNDAARAEVEALNRFRRDEVLRLHIPRLLKTTWLQAEETLRALPPASRRVFPALEGHALLLEFDDRAGKSVAEYIVQVSLDD